MLFWGVGGIWLLTSKKKSTIITDLCRIVSIRLYSLWMRLYCMTISANTIKHYQICLYISVKSFTSQYWLEGIGILLKIHHLSSFPYFQAFQSLPKSPPLWWFSRCPRLPSPLPPKLSRPRATPSRQTGQWGPPENFQMGFGRFQGRFRGENDFLDGHLA